MIVTVFRSRVRTDLSADVLQRLAQLGTRMHELATAMPGFVSYKDFSSEDGESVTIVEFETMEDNLRWRKPSRTCGSPGVRPKRRVPGV